MNKIAVIGAGRVGEQTAQFIAMQNIVSEIALLDVREGAAEGAALDIAQSSPVFKFDTRLSGSSDPAIIAGADLVVITAGMPRKPGMSRSDLLASNIGIVDSVIDSILKYAADSILLFVSNPVDIVTYHAIMRTGWPRNRILGQAGVLDSSRMATFIAMETGTPISDIQATVLGGHGDTMVPLLRHSTMAGKPLTEALPDDKLEALVERTRHGGAEVLGLRKTSSAYNAPAASTLEMVLAIYHDSKKVIPTVAMLDGEYGHRNLAIGVPATLGSNGMEAIIELDMTADEQALFDHSVKLVNHDLGLLREIEAA